MPTLPAHGQPNWDPDLNAYIDDIKATANAAETPTGAQAKANAAQSNAVATASGDATTKANNAKDDAITAAASDATTKANAVQANLSAHTANTTNPHAVTKAQVGLSDVDNTSDAAKPVSTAQQTALDAKQNAASLDTDVAAKVNDAASSTRAALSAAYGGVTGARPGNRTVWLGDSITQWQDAQANQNAPTSSELHSQRTSLGNLGSILSKQRLRYVTNAGKGGYTTAQLLGTFDADVAAHAPTVVPILAGTNDVGTDVPLATTAANIAELVARTRAIGAVPILGTIPPKGDRQAMTHRLNTWIRQYAGEQGLAVIDYHTLLTDPATGDYLAAYARAGDAVHPGDPGFVAMAEEAARVATSVVPEWAPPLAVVNTDPNNLITNGLYLNNSGSYPSSFSGAPAQTGLTHSIITGDTSIKGNWHKMDCAATGSTTQLFQNIATAPVPGHRYLFAGRIKTTWASGNGVQVRNRINLSSGSVDMMPLNNMAVNISDGVFLCEYVCPVDAVSQQFSLFVYAGTASIQTAQLTLIDLTAQGVV